MTKTLTIHLKDRVWQVGQPGWRAEKLAFPEIVGMTDMSIYIMPSNLQASLNICITACLPFNKKRILSDVSK